MAIDERSRHDLYMRLEAVLGPEPATTLMSHLPPVGWADVATKHDLEMLATGVRAELATGLSEVRREMSELRGEMSELRGDMSELGGDMSELRAGLAAGLAQLRADVVGQMVSQTRTMIVAIVTVILTMASLSVLRG